jgi:hypothetical protein
MWQFPDQAGAGAANPPHMQKFDLAHDLPWWNKRFLTKK